LPIEPLSKAKASLIRALQRRKGRREHGAFLAEGERTLSELAHSDARVLFAYARDEAVGTVSAMFPDVAVYRVDERAEASLFATESSQGVAVVVEVPEYPSIAAIDRSAAPILVLDAVADPGNLGTIIRSAEWFAIAGVLLLPGCADPFNPKSVRASMGSLVRVAIAEATIDDVAELDRPLFALDAKGSRVLGRDVLPRRASYVIGSEAHGISKEIAALGEGLAILGRGSVESLNAAIAASVLCYELSRLDE
jgi:RNA methyltransferase, TrmH family